MFAKKWTYQYKIWHARCPDMFQQHIFWFLIFQISGLSKIYVNVSVIFSFGGENYFAKHYNTILEKALIHLFCCFLFVIFANLFFGDFLLAFICFRPNMAWH